MIKISHLVADSTESL